MLSLGPNKWSAIGYQLCKHIIGGNTWLSLKDGELMDDITNNTLKVEGCDWAGVPVMYCWPEVLPPIMKQCGIVIKQTGEIEYDILRHGLMNIEDADTKHIDVPFLRNTCNSFGLLAFKCWRHSDTHIHTHKDILSCWGCVFGAVNT